MKKTISLILAVITAMSLLYSTASAEEMEEISFDEVTLEMPTGELPFIEEYDGEISETEYVPKRRVLKPIREYLEEQFLTHSEIIDLFEYQVVLDEDFKNMVKNVIASNYKIICAGIAYRTNGENVVAYIKPTYPLDTEEEDENARKFMEEQIKTEYLDKVKDIPCTDVLGKMLVIHDLFCQKNAYAHEELDEYNELKRQKELGEIEDFDVKKYIGIWTAYNLFKNNRAVCQGNSIALKAIYDALNEELKEELGTSEDIIKVAFCRSDSLNHIWNVVNVGEKWYHLDETWNDSSKYAGYSYHNYFLVSEDQMSDHKKDDDWVYLYDEKILCDDKKYESGYFFNDLSQMPSDIFYDNGRYGIHIYRAIEPLWTDNLKSVKLLTSDVFKDGEINRIIYFTREDVTVNRFLAEYGDKGKLTQLSRFSPMVLEGKKLLNKGFKTTLSKFRVFHWSGEDIEPLCRVLEVK